MKCPRCGNSGFTVKVRICLICRSAGCARCSSGWIPVAQTKKYSEFVCSEQCLYQWCLRKLPYYQSDVLARLVDLMPMTPGAEPILNPVSPQAARMLDLMLAQKLEGQGKFTEAAKIYDFYQMETDYQRVMKLMHEQIESYLHALKTMNRDVVYKCPKCGYNIKIPAGATISSLATCLFCTAPLDPGDIALFLRGILHPEFKR